jgi:uncharacterized protein DUF5666
MQRRSFLVSILSISVGGAALMAHDVSKHKGKPVHGNATEVTAESFQLQTEKGPRKIGVTAKTKFERGDQPASLEDLVNGAQVTVFGTVLGDGKEIVAKEIIFKEADHHPRMHKH